MTWTQLEQQGRVTPEPTTKAEIDDLRVLVDRNLQDASLPALSTDGRFSMAYNAARTLATIAIRASGYRVKHVGGGHYNTFLALPVAMGPAFDTVATYFDTCRQSRNDLSYDAANVVSASDAAELVKRTTQFHMDVEAWLRSTHPTLV